MRLYPLGTSHTSHDGQRFKLTSVRDPHAHCRQCARSLKDAAAWTGPRRRLYLNREHPAIAVPPDRYCQRCQHFLGLEK